MLKKVSWWRGKRVQTAIYPRIGHEKWQTALCAQMGLIFESDTVREAGWPPGGSPGVRRLSEWWTKTQLSSPRARWFSLCWVTRVYIGRQYYCGLRRCRARYPCETYSLWVEISVVYKVRYEVLPPLPSIEGWRVRLGSIPYLWFSSRGISIHVGVSLLRGSRSIDLSQTFCMVISRTRWVRCGREPPAKSGLYSTPNR